MKYYMKFMLCAVAFGILNTLIYGENMHTAEQVFLLWGFGQTSLLMAEAPIFISAYFPMLFFNVFWGTYIYKHFCSGSVYYFSRCKNITKWYMKECLHLYLYTLGYLGVLIASGMICALAVWHITLSASAMAGFIYYFAIHSLFLFSVTLCINIVSIWISDSNGFVYVEGAILFLIATFFFVGENAFPEDIVTPDKMWIIKVNPISHIIFSMHSSSIPALNEAINMYGVDFELNHSVALLLLLSVITVIAGRFSVERHNFINTNLENGG